MARVFVLDSDPAGLACHEPGNPEGGDLRHWIIKEWAVGSITVIPAIIDYEVRRSLILNEIWDGLERLDALYEKFVRYLPISQDAMKRAAGLWAKARREHRPTATERLSTETSS